MPDFSSLFVTRAGEPVKVGNQTITVTSRALRAMPPMGFGGLVWNRPVAVKVETAEGAVHVLPVVDATRRSQAMVMLFGLVAALLMVLIFASRRPEGSLHK